MSANEIPRMEPLTPIVDRMRLLAREELPSPRTCKVRLWDDGTFDVMFFHSMCADEKQYLRYERTTGEILWEYCTDVEWRAEKLTGGETVHEPVVNESDVRVVATVEPPYR